VVAYLTTLALSRRETLEAAPAPATAG
jgi:hypothetical protein